MNHETQLIKLVFNTVLDKLSPKMDKSHAMELTLSIVEGISLGLSGMNDVHVREIEVPKVEKHDSMGENIHAPFDAVLTTRCWNADDAEFCHNTYSLAYKGQTRTFDTMKEVDEFCRSHCLKIKKNSFINSYGIDY